MDVSNKKFTEEQAENIVQELDSNPEKPITLIVMELESDVSDEEIQLIQEVLEADNLVDSAEQIYDGMAIPIEYSSALRWLQNEGYIVPQRKNPDSVYNNIHYNLTPKAYQELSITK